MPSTQCLIIMHSIVHMRTVFPCEKVRGSSGGVLTWYHGLGGGRLFGARVYQSMGRLLEEIWYLPHMCTDVAFASGMFLFWKILTCSTPKDTYEKLIEHDSVNSTSTSNFNYEYGFICMKQFYYLAKIVVKNCRCQFEVLASLKSRRFVSICNACGGKRDKQIVMS